MRLKREESKIKWQKSSVAQYTQANDKKDYKTNAIIITPSARVDMQKWK